MNLTGRVARHLIEDPASRVRVVPTLQVLQPLFRSRLAGWRRLNKTDRYLSNDVNGLSIALIF